MRLCQKYQSASRTAIGITGRSVGSGKSILLHQWNYSDSSGKCRIRLLLAAVDREVKDRRELVRKSLSNLLRRSLGWFLFCNFLGNQTIIYSLRLVVPRSPLGAAED